MKISLHRRIVVLVAAMATALVGLSVPTPVGAAPAMAPHASGVRLNEAQTSNSATLTDQAGTSPDWLELYNESAGTVSLAGWSLSDDAAAPDQWVFPAGTSINAGATLLVFASGTGVNVGGELHTNFKLSSSGEYLGLYDATGELVSSFDPIPAIPGDYSWGVNPAGVLNLFDLPTPNAANGTGSLGLLGDVSVAPERGFYDAPVQVSLSAEANTTIRYTLDGSMPSATVGTLYSSPITVSGTTVVRSVAIRNGWTSPKPVTSTYLFVDDVPDQPLMDANIVGANRADVTAGLSSLPVISLTSVNPDNTARFTWDQTDESPVAVEMIFPDGTAGFQVDAGAKEVGGHSVRYDKDSLRLKFGSEWGESSLDYPVFAGADNPASPATDSFKRLTLRMGAHDTLFYEVPSAPYRSYMRARWHDETMLDLGHTNTHGRYVNVFLNGQYWGQYHLREHLDDHFMASYEGGDNSEYVGINQGVVTAGTGTSWAEFSSARGKWDTFSQIVDPVNYVDFMLLSEYGGNAWDLNHFRNWRAAGPATTGPDAIGYVFVSSDPDISLVSTDTTTLFNGPLSSWSALLSEQHPDFMDLLAARMQVLFADGGVLGESAARDRWNRIAAQIDQSVHSEYARWGKLSPQAWEANNGWFRNTLFPVRAGNVTADLQLRLPDLVLGGGAPVITDPGPQSSVVGDALTLAVSATDPDGDAVSWSATGLPAGLTIDPDSGVISGAAREAGVFSVAVTAADLSAASDTATFDWTTTFPSPSRVILNEWNAVDNGVLLKNGGSDSALGVVAGNGGDWFELVVIEDHLDLRGWTLELADEDNPDGVLEITDEFTFARKTLLSDLRAGTIITVSEDFADDPSYDPEAGDWTINLQANSADEGAFFTSASQSNFGVNNQNWQLLIRDADGQAVFGPAGEGAGASGVGSDEIGELEADPTGAITPASAYDDGSDSTFGEPNGFDGRLQDFSLIRPVLGVDVAEPDSVIGSPVLNEVLSGPAVVISGSASDDVGVAGVSLAIRNRDSGEWLRSDGSFGAFQFNPAVVDSPGGAATGWSFSAVLPEGNWFVLSRAEDTSGNLDTTRASTRFVVAVTAVDTVEPDSVIASPLVNEVLSGPGVVISGSASDDVGVAGVSLAIRNRDSGEWLRSDGSFGAFQFNPAVVDSPGGAATGWSFSAVLPEGNWFVLSRAEDTSGNLDTTRAMARFVVADAVADVTAPDGLIVTPVHRGTSTGPVLTVTGTATDNVGVSTVRVSVQDLGSRLWLQADGTFGASYAQRDATLDTADASATDWSLVVNGLAPGDYAVTARAVDAAGNTDPVRPRHKVTIN